MFKILLSIFCFLILLSSKCKKEGDDCHYHISIRNNSDGKVLWGIISNGIYGCRFSGNELEKNETAEYDFSHYCIEDILKDGETKQIYIVDPNNYNPPNVYYSCDSVEYENNVLKKYILTLDDLKQNNFTIIYQ
jgi:hypothetical protein